MPLAKKAFAVLVGALAASAFSREEPSLPLQAPPFQAMKAPAPETERVKASALEAKDGRLACGSKSVALDSNGAASLFAEGKKSGQFTLDFRAYSPKLKEPLYLVSASNWPERNFDKEKAVFKEEKAKWTCVKHLRWEDGEAKVSATLEIGEGGLPALRYEWPQANAQGAKLEASPAIFEISRSEIGDDFCRVDGESVKLPPEGETQIPFRKTGFKEACLFAGDPDRSFKILGDQSCREFFVDCRKGSVLFRIAPKGNSLSFRLDISGGRKLTSSAQTYAGIDFQAVDGLELPDFKASRNLIQNPSFEQGFDYYWDSHHVDYKAGERPEALWSFRPFELDGAAKAPFGESCLRMAAAEKAGTDFRFGNVIRTFSMPLAPGKYVFSVYAKGEPGKRTRLSAWLPNAAWLGNRFLPIGWTKSSNGAQKVFDLGSDWKRLYFSFEVLKSMPAHVALGADCDGSEGFVWIDALQLEPGETPSEFAVSPIAAKLLTAQSGNFLTAGKPVGARLEISTRPNAKGALEASVKNAFNEEVFRKSFKLSADERGHASVELPLDGALPRGVFRLKASYELSDGTKTYSLHRLSSMDFLENKHRLKNVFAEDYGTPEGRYDFLALLERYRQIGIGAKNHCHSKDQAVWERYRSYGVEPTDSGMLSDLFDSNRKTCGFALAEAPLGWGAKIDAPGVLLRDFKLDTPEKEPTDEYLARFKAAVAKIAKERPWIGVWTPTHETFARFPVSWWSSDGSVESAWRNYAKILKAFVEGVKEGNPDAMVYPDAPSNMNPEAGIASIAKTLESCSRQGGPRFDLFACHTYRKSPESPDLDADAQTLFNTLSANGYPDAKALWNEGMHYGPYSIPEWGVETAAWLPPQCWYYGALTYDIGRTETLSAALHARSWLVALKRQDRVLSAMSGAFNNFEMDLYMTPFAKQKVPNTLGRLLGDAVFKADLRFAPYVRCFLFEDASKRPVAAVWCHNPNLDAGRIPAPEAEASFEGSLERIYDLFECERSFEKSAPGPLRFPLTSAPIFFIGKPGALEPFQKAFERAALVSGEGMAPLLLSAKPINAEEAEASAKNFLSRAFEGALETQGGKTPFQVPASKTASARIKLPLPLRDDAIVGESLPLALNDGKRSFTTDASFEAFLCRKAKAPIRLGSDEDWSAFPGIEMKGRLARRQGAKASDAPGFSGLFKCAWTEQGLHLRVEIKDPKFLHKPPAKPSDIAARWDNDSLQIFIDCLCDGRSRQQKGVYGDADYDYAIFPNEDGKGAVFYRYRTPDPQLGLATMAPKDGTIAEDIPTSFKLRPSGYLYEAFIPAKYLLPAKLEKGSALGFALMANDRDSEREGSFMALTTTPDGTCAHMNPHLWPAMLLEE